MADPEVPPWLDAAFLTTALQGGEVGDHVVKVTKFSAEPAVAAGENYTSRLYRIKVDYEEEKENKKCTSLIVKAPFTNGAMNVVVDESDFYSKEPNVYNRLLPIMNEAAKCEFGPKSYYSSINNALILSDLKEQGYKMCNRYKQLDFTHCEHVLKVLAKFHAASVLCKRDHPDVIELVGRELFYTEGEKYDKTLRHWLKQSLQKVSEVIQEMKISDYIVDLLVERAEEISGSMIRMSKSKRSGLNVLNHGDLWSNNILFKYSNSGDIIDTRLVDFQMTKYTSPVMDLIDLLWTSANEDVRDGRLQDLLETYRITLNSNLKELGLEERLTDEELREDMRNAMDAAIITVVNKLPLLVCDVEDVITISDVSPEEMTGEIDDKFLKKFNGKHYRAMLPKVITHLLSWMEHYK